MYELLSIFLCVWHVYTFCFNVVDSTSIRLTYRRAAMTEYNSQDVKRDEQYPLLKVEAGDSESNPAQVPFPKNIALGWNVTCTPKQSCLKRWPEYVSVCWMTIILLAISFLVFYALGMSIYRRQPVVVVRCNSSKPAGEVFYHHILSQDYIPFTMFSDYLSSMAKEHPALHFHVYFLIDDTWQMQSRRQPKLVKQLVPHFPGPFNTMFQQNHKREIRYFQRKFQNVNVSVMFLSKYMGMTPLRYKWKMIPQNYLTFYARIYEIWQNGGVGFDLVTFNNQFNINKELNQRVNSILKQYSNGIAPEKYAEVRSVIDNEDQDELYSIFFSLVNHIINETSQFFITDFPTDIKIIDHDLAIRTRKRDIVIDSDVLNNTINGTYFSNTTLKLKDKNDIELYNITEKENVVENKTSLENATKLVKNDDDLIKTPNIYEIYTDTPQLLLFYDINGFSGETGPSYRYPKATGQSDSKIDSSSDHGNQKSKYLLLSPEGYFVAASSRHHPFLTHLFSSSCQMFDPKYAIRDTLLSQCAGFFRDDVYCENIHVIYDVV